MITYKCRECEKTISYGVTMNESGTIKLVSLNEEDDGWIFITNLPNYGKSFVEALCPSCRKALNES